MRIALVRARARADPRCMAHVWTFPILAVRKVVDGDTLDLELDLGFSISIRQRVRLQGIDTPEIASKDSGDRERAKAAREFTAAWCSRQAEIRAETTKDDKYGRMLAELVGDGGCRLTEDLLAARLAKRYGRAMRSI